MASMRVLGVALSCAVVVTACSSGSKSTSSTSPSSSGGSSSGGSSSGGASGKVTSIKVGTSPAVSNVPLYLAGSSGGAFSKHNLKFTPQVVTGGAVAIPLLLNGQLQFTAGDALGAMVAISHKTPLVMVAVGNSAGSDAAHDNTGLVVKPNIASPADLSGKTIAVNALNGLAEITSKAAIDASGGDSKKVKFVETPIPQMAAAVKAGTVDGAVTTEPFLTAAKQQGLKDLLPIFSRSLPGVPQIAYITSKSYLASHPDVVKAFADSIKESNEEVTKDPSKIKTVALTSTKSTQAQLDATVLPVFTPATLQVDILNKLQTLAQKYGALQRTFDPTPYVYTG